VVVVLIIALIVFGPKRIPELSKSLGNGIRNFKSALDGEDDGAEGEVDRVEPAQLPASSEPAAATEAETAEDRPTVQSRI
jgi:sec-independent protein translocase protein TatA